jgi:hypothetical protein
MRGGNYGRVELSGRLDSSDGRIFGLTPREISRQSPSPLASLGRHTSSATSTEHALDRSCNFLTAHYTPAMSMCAFISSARFSAISENQRRIPLRAHYPVHRTHIAFDHSHFQCQTASKGADKWPRTTTSAMSIEQSSTVSTLSQSERESELLDITVVTVQ